VRKNIFPLSFAFIFLVFALLIVLKASSKSTNASSVKNVNISYNTKAESKESYKTASALLFDSLHLDKLGLSYEALEYALKGYLHLEEKGALQNPGVLTICDFSQSSFKKRMYIIDVNNFKVLFNTYVAHGRNSGTQFAEKFSNNPESLQSSLGFFITKNIYNGKHGMSLKLDGQEKGINDKAEERAVVVHGADYIGDSRLSSPFMGRSFGCPAVPQAQASKVISLIKDGTCLFIYHPSKNYLTGSKILNG
jgi:hypothetical protein